MALYFISDEGTENFIKQCPILSTRADINFDAVIFALARDDAVTIPEIPRLLAGKLTTDVFLEDTTTIYTVLWRLCENAGEGKKIITPYSLSPSVAMRIHFYTVGPKLPRVPTRFTRSLVRALNFSRLMSRNVSTVSLWFSVKLWRLTRVQ